MKKNFDFEQIGERYDPKNTYRFQDSPRVTWAEKALYDAVKALSLRVGKLELRSEITPPDLADLEITVYPPDLKLFVWTEVLGRGVALALAHNVTEARMVVVRDKEDWMDVSEIFEKEPEIIESPEGFALYGGG